ncbi:MAG: formyltransferase family protein [Verrucomicrobiota bacterium]
MKFVLLSTKGIHHTYFIHRVLEAGFEIDSVFYETGILKPPFDVTSRFDNSQRIYEERVFGEYSLEDPSSLTYFQFKSLNSDAAVQAIKERKADIGIVFGCGKLDTSVIQCFPLLLNIHKGFAERYRGLDTDLWPIFHAEYRNIGVTLHKVAPSLDTGDLVEALPVFLGRGMKIEELRVAWVKLATEMSIRSLEKFEKGTLETTKQKSIGRYYTFMPSDLRNLAADRFDRFCSRL